MRRRRSSASDEARATVDEIVRALGGGGETELLFYLYAGRIELARPIVARATAADPLTGLSWSLAAVLEWFAGRFPDALLPARKAIDIDPENGTARWILGYTRALNSDIDGAGEIALWMNGRDRNSPYARQLTAVVDAARGHSDRALATLALSQKRASIITCRSTSRRATSRPEITRAGWCYSKTR